MYKKISDEQFDLRVKEFLDYVTLNKCFPKRGKKDVKFSDGSCLMGEWFKTNRNRLSANSFNKNILHLVSLSNMYMKKTDKKSIDDRFHNRVVEMIKFVTCNNYFPNKDDNIYFDDKSSFMYIWYYCNKNRLKDLIARGDIYAKKLFSLEQKYKNHSKKNKYPKNIVFQNNNYTYNEFAKFLGIDKKLLSEYLDGFCKDIYNIKSIELERIRNCILNLNRLKKVNDSSFLYNDYDKNTKNYCIKKHINYEIFNNQINKLIGIGLSKEEAVCSSLNEYKNNDCSIPISWIYNAYPILEQDDISYDKNEVISIIMNKGFSFNNALLLYVVEKGLENYNEMSYMKDIIFYTLINSNYDSSLSYSKSLFKLNDFQISLIEKINNDYKSCLVSNNYNDILQRKMLLEELVSNYDYYSLNKKAIQEKYNLSRFEIMSIEARYNEINSSEEMFNLSVKKR